MKNVCALSRPARPGAAGTILFVLSLGLPYYAQADWSVLKHRPEGATTDTVMAHSKNTNGYILEIYRDSVGAVRSRFTLSDGLTMLAERSCPTFQIDRGVPVNRSINEAACLSTERWAEFVLGYVAGSRVISPRLLALMNGNSIAFRFRLAAGDYRETQFSLLGSKRSMTEALGTDVTVTAR